jgi:hypothetical protein
MRGFDISGFDTSSTQHSTAQQSSFHFSINSLLTSNFHSTKTSLRFTSIAQNTNTFAMASTTFTSTQSIVLFGRGGYNGPAEGEDEDSHSSSQPMNFGRGGYNRGPDDDEEEDGRGGYN